MLWIGKKEDHILSHEILLHLKRLGLNIGPKLVVGDGAAGFLVALREIYSVCREQRCWLDWTANVLDKMPESVQGKAKFTLHEMWQTPTRVKALAAYEHSANA